MGEVYLAEHLLPKPLLRREADPAPGDAIDPKVLAGSSREVRLTATLCHPNIIEIYDYGRRRGRDLLLRHGVLERLRAWPS